MNSILADLQFYFESGGYVMPPLALATVILWYALGYRYWVLRRGSVRSVRNLIERYSKQAPESTRGLVEEAILMGISIKRSQKLYTRRYMDDSFHSFLKEAKRYRSLVTAIVVSAPLMGLLGTVTGMIETFDSLADMSLFSQSGGIAGGISQALFTTQMGLAVAIPGLVVKGLLDRKQKVLEMELAQIKDILCAKPTEGQSKGAPKI